MMTRRPRRRAGFSLVEVLVAMAVTSIIAGVILVSTSVLRKTFFASEDYAVAQGDQLRLSDSLAMDIRRALPENRGGVPNTVETNANGNILRVRIPFYTSAVAPTVTAEDRVSYDQGTPVEVIYYQQGQYIYRSAGGSPVILAEAVSDFIVNTQLQDSQRTIVTTVKFLSRFNKINETDFTLAEKNANAQATTLTNRTFIRNQ